MTAIKSVFWAVTAHRSYKFGPYVTSVASKAHYVIFKGMPPPPPAPPNPWVRTYTK